jgi:hypothetical protein
MEPQWLMSTWILTEKLEIFSSMENQSGNSKRNK